MKTVNETPLQQCLLSYPCPECSSSQLITKPSPKAVKGGGVAIFTSIIKCANPKCNCERKVRRFPDGTYRSFKIVQNECCTECGKNLPIDWVANTCQWCALADM